MKTFIVSVIAASAVPVILHAAPALSPPGIINDITPNLEFGIKTLIRA